MSEISKFLKENSTFVKDKKVSDLKCRDPEDIKVLSLADSTKADALVTEDQDLLVLKSIRGIGCCMIIGFPTNDHAVGATDRIISEFA